MMASYHRSNLGSFLANGLLIDRDGYVPLPGSSPTDFHWGGDSDDFVAAMVEGEEFDGETWEDRIERNAQLTREAEDRLEEWQQH